MEFAFKIDRTNRVKMRFEHFSVRKSVKFQEAMLFLKYLAKVINTKISFQLNWVFAIKYAGIPPKSNKYRIAKV